jgi:putative endonuclease
LSYRRKPVSRAEIGPGFRRDDKQEELRVFYVYLRASKPQGTLDVGVTSDLPKRVFEHKSKAMPGYTARYGVDILVWFEASDTAEAAIRREKQIKEWRRKWKISLIEQDNPHWIDLYSSLTR